MMEFIVDLDPEGLEGSGRRVNSLGLKPLWDHTINDLSQLLGRFNGTSTSLFNDGPCNSPGPSFFPVFSQNVLQFSALQLMKSFAVWGR
jgi:hypothetical protein